MSIRSACAPAGSLREPPPLPRIAASNAYPWLVVATVCVGAFLGQLDASIAGLILPTLETTFHAAIADVEWVAIAYLLVLAALVVPLGRLSDLMGRKLLYTFGFLVGPHYAASHPACRGSSHSAACKR